MSLKPLILSMINHYGYHDTFEENYQNAMVVLFESIYEYKPDKNVTFAAFYKLKLFYFFVDYNKEKGCTDVYATDISYLENISDNSIGDPSDHMIWQEDRGTLHLAIEKLTKRQKWLIDNHYFKGKTLTQIAEENGLNSQSLVKLKAKALENLKTFLKQSLIN